MNNIEKNITILFLIMAATNLGIWIYENNWGAVLGWTCAIIWAFKYLIQKS